VDSGTLAFSVPRGVESTAIAKWNGSDGVKWTVKQLGKPEALEGNETVLTPHVTPGIELAVHLMNSPVGWAQGELVYRGIRTGLNVGDGVVSPRQAMTLATTGEKDEDLSFWVSVSAGTVLTDSPRASMGISIPLDRGSLGLWWPGEPQLDPLPRDELNAVPISREDGVWRIRENTLDATWIDAKLEGLGVCRNLNWRVIGPPSEVFELPLLDSASIFEAPMIRGDVSAVWMQGGSFADIVSNPVKDRLLPRHTAKRTEQSVKGFWRQFSTCDQHPSFGRYAVHRADQSTCAVDGVADVYLVDRCGKLVRISAGSGEQPEHCGMMTDTRFESFAGQSIEVEPLNGAGLKVGPGVTGFLLVPIAQPDVSANDRLVGDWTRFEITEQDFLLTVDGFEQAQNDPVLISVGRGDGGPWLKVNAAGRARAHAHLADFDLSLREVDGERVFLVDAPGCHEKPRILKILPDTEALVLRERLPRERADEIRIRTYTYRR
jgi:hypothetical protein